MYRAKTSPRQHQVEAIWRVKDMPTAYAWLMEMGTGKSKVILDEFGILEDRGVCQQLLIVAPAGAYGNWCRIDDEDPGEIQKHVGDDLFRRLTVFQWVSGKKPALPKKATLPRALIMNVEALSTVKAARTLCEDFLKAAPTMMVIDESTSVKNPKAKRTKQILRLGELAEFRRIATGLVSPRSPMDLYSQFEFLDWRILGFKSYYAFRARHAVMQNMQFGGRAVKVIVGYRAVDELQQKIGEHSYRVLKEDCLDLEPKIYASRDVPLTAEQLKIYTSIKTSAMASLGDERYVSATQVITQILRLDQVLCGHVVDEEGMLHDIPERRIAVMMDVISEHRGKVIIWVAYDHCIGKIQTALETEYGKGCVARFWGGNRGTRNEEERRFKSDPDCRFMVSTPGAGGKGNTWVVADLVIYHSSTNNLEHRAQSEDRAHRDGQTRSVQYVDLVARGTVDEKKLKALRAKIDMSSLINGDNYREWLI
jgi:SNF2 family DNA or RNA helicase